MEKYFDNIFEKLYKEPEVSELWYKARHYVMDIMPPLDIKDGKTALNIDSKKYIHVVADSAGKEMLAVIRQICLLAHYPNFKESTNAHRTIVTIENCAFKSVAEINNEVSFGKLFEHCQYSFDMIPYNTPAPYNDYFPLDIEFEFLSNKREISISPDEILIELKHARVKDAFDNYEIPEKGIDITKGVYVNMVYNVGVEIDNLPACDNDNVRRYDTALRVFCYKLKKDHIKKKWDETAKPNVNGEYNEIDVKNQLSSIFCADCFESRLRSILDISKKSVKEYLVFDIKEVMNMLCSESDEYKTINGLAYCEHNRWNVERLIMGFSPLEDKDRFDLECVFGKERKNKIKFFKNEKRHIDLCSNRDLRRINPTDVKYDYFLMLAMPHILLSSFQSYQHE